MRMCTVFRPCFCSAFFIKILKRCKQCKSLRDPVRVRNRQADADVRIDARKWDWQQKCFQALTTKVNRHRAEVIGLALENCTKIYLTTVRFRTNFGFHLEGERDGETKTEVGAGSAPRPFTLTTGKSLLTIYDSLTDGTNRWLVPVHAKQSERRPRVAYRCDGP